MQTGFISNGWEYQQGPDGKYHPVRPSAGQTGGASFVSKAADPTLPLAMEERQLGIQDKRNDLANADTQARMLEAQARLAEAQARKAEQDQAAGKQLTDSQQQFKSRIANLNSLTQQINRVDSLYQQNLKGQPLTRGFGLSEYLPTPGNSQFNAATAGLGEQGLAAFRVPGVGGQSDAELKQFVEANRPSHTDYDSSVEEKLRQLRGRVDATRGELGLPPAEWGTKQKEEEEPQGLAVDITDDRFPGETDAQYRARVDGGGPPLVRSSGGSPRDTAPGAVDAFGRGAADSLSFGLADEMSAGLNAVLPLDRLTGRDVASVWDGTPLSQAYNQNLGMERRINAADEAFNPAARMGGQLGAVGIGGIGAARALPGLAAQLGSGGTAARLGKTLAADAAYGAAYGAGSGIEGNRLGSAGQGAAYGAIGGAIGRGAVGGLSRVISPVSSPAVRQLAQEGVTMTPGQILGASGGPVGRFVKATEDRVAGFPVVGDVINSARRRGMERYSIGTVNRALQPLGIKVPKDLPAGHQTVAFAQQAVSDAIEQALANVQAPADGALRLGLAKVNSAAKKLPEAQRQAFEAIVQRDVQPLIPETGVLNGRGLQGIKQALDAHASAFRNSPQPTDRLLGDVLQDARDEFMALAGRADPQAAGAFKRANEAFARLVRVDSAAKMAPDGVFSPKQFGTAVRQADRSSRKRATARGEALMQDWAKVGSEVLPSSVPDSGTAGRLALGVGVAGGLPSLGGSAAAALPYLPGMDRLTQKILIERPEILRRGGQALRRHGLFGSGMVGAPAGFALFPQQ